MARRSRGLPAKRRQFLQTAGAFAVASAAAGCTGSDGGGGGGNGGGGNNTTSRGPKTFQNKAGVKVGATFEAVKELAREEKAATVYATIDRGPFQKWLKAFYNAHPEVKIDHVTGGNEKLNSRWTSEYETNNVQGNLYIASTGIQSTWQNDQVMELNPDYMPSFGEAPAKFKSDDGWWIATRQVLGNVFYNTNQVSADDAGSWTDVASKETWQGRKIGWDPTPNMFLMGWLRDNTDGDFFQHLHDANPRWVDSHTDLVRLCGAGEYPVAFSYTHKMGRFGDELPISYFKFDPTPAQISPLVISNKAPQPNTALLFANWLTSVEGQKAIGNTQYIPFHPEAEYTGYPDVYPSDKYTVNVIPPTTDVKKVRKMWNNTMGDLISSGDTD